MSAIRAAFRVEVQLDDGSSPAPWTSLGRDVCSTPGIFVTSGNQQNGPLDHVAPIGQLTFDLRNDASNSGATLGWYSENHVNCRTGWRKGIPIRVVSAYRSVALGDVSAQDRVLWTGKVAAIRPSPGLYRDRRVSVTGEDCMADLAAADVVEITPQITQTETALLAAVVAAMPASAQPVATNFDSGIDSYPYAFDTIGSGLKAMSAMADVILSAYGWLYPTRDGTLRYENRHTRALKRTQYTFTDATLNLLDVPSDLANVFNRVRVTIHPRTIDAVADTVLCAAGGALEVAPRQTVELFDSYRATDNALQLIGGTAFVTPLVAGADYVANAVSDGSGSDLTANVTVTVQAFASAAKFTITNTGPQTAFLTSRQLRGKGIYDEAPVVFEAAIAKSYGDRPLDIDLPYQTDPNIAQGFADYIAQLYSSQMFQADDLGFDPQRSDALMTQALTRDVGDVITASETMTGLSAALLAILGVEMTIAAGNLLHVRYIVSYAGSGLIFILDDTTFGVLDSALAPLGYA